MTVSYGRLINELFTDAAKLNPCEAILYAREPVSSSNDRREMLPSKPVAELLK